MVVSAGTVVGAVALAAWLISDLVLVSTASKKESLVTFGASLDEPLENGRNSRLSLSVALPPGSAWAIAFLLERFLLAREEDAFLV